MVKLTNVVDTRTGQYHSVAIVKEKNVKWFEPYDPGGEDEEDEE